MTEPARESRSMEDDLVSWGKVITLETRGRRSGLTRRVTIGFVDEGEGALLVAAADGSTGWAANLIAEPACYVERGAQQGRYRAVALEGAAHAAAISALILKYGAPSERLGGGPAFRLVPVQGAG